MDIPGQSLFQGGGSLDIDHSAQRRQEQENQMDQLRLHNEVGNLLEKAFDDLSDVDETIESTAFNSTHNQNGYAAGFPHPIHDLPPSIPLMNNRDATNPVHRNELESLRKALESKTMECKHLTNSSREDKKRYDDHINELQKRLALSDSEKERSHMSRQQTHELLVKSKGTISEQENTIQKHVAKIKELESRNLELLTDLDHQKTMINDLQLKFQMIERNVGLSNGRHDEQLLKQTRERYAGQIDMLQQQIDGLRMKLEEKELELKRSNVNYKELQRSREAILVEKSDTINQLSKTIEDSQRQCQQLMSKGDMLQENMMLKNTINSLSRKHSEMQEEINNLTKSFDDIYSELKNVYESVNPDVNVSLEKNTNFADMDRTFYILTVLTRLKSEINRFMMAKIGHDIAIKKLEAELDEKNADIKKLKDDENNALVQMINYKDESHRLTNRLKVLQSEIDRLSNLNRTDTRHQIEFEEMVDKLSNLQKEYSDLAEENASLRNELKNSVAGLHDEAQNDSEIINDAKNQTSCSKCIAKMSELAMIQISNLELQNDRVNHVKEITDLTTTINVLKDKQVENENHLVALQHGARKFEEFIKNQDDNGTKESPSHTIDRQVELKMAKILATKIKAIEMKFQEQIDLSVRNMDALKADIDDARQVIVVKSKEVQLLKQAILSERRKMTELLAQRDDETNNLFERNNKLFKECQHKLQSAQHDLMRLQTEHSSCSASLEAAQRSMAELTTEKQRIAQREANLVIRISEMEQNMTYELERWSVKYNAAKKTAAHYKKYAEAKDQHIEQENLRIKSIYEATIKKMQSNILLANKKD